MAEQFPRHIQEDQMDEISPSTPSVDVELTLAEQQAQLSALYEKINVTDLIDKLTILQQWQPTLTQLQDHINAIEGGLDQLDTALLELDEDPRKISEAIEEAERRIEAANLELRIIRDQTAVLEDEIDELDDRVDEESVRTCEDRRTTLGKLNAQKETQRTIKQLQGRAIKELEIQLAAIQADLDIERTANASSRAQYVEQSIVADRRLHFLSEQLGKVANAATAIMAAAEYVTDMPPLGNLPPLPGRLNARDPFVVVDAHPAYRLSDTPTDVWLHSPAAVTRSVPVYFELPDAPELSVLPMNTTDVEEPKVEDGPLPYRQIHQLLLHERPRLTQPSARTVAQKIINPIKK